MIRVDAYQCSSCGKLFLTEKGCIKHEKTFCSKSPHNLAACYSCKMYKQTEQTMTITRVGSESTEFEFEYEKEIQINICLKHNAKLFNSFHASKGLIDDVVDNDFLIMPTIEEGCLYYKEKENERT